MTARGRLLRLMATIIALVAIIASVALAGAVSIDDPAFQRTWERTDKPVVDGLKRTWMWGTEAYRPIMTEPYDEAPGNVRRVQYFDKSRMEDNSYRASAPWDVTNGLLVVEMVAGKIQLGDNNFDESPDPANVNVAGDWNDPTGPTYATFSTLLGSAPHPAGSVITARVNRNGQITDDPSLATYNATAANLVDVPGILHQVASPFWAFMNSSGPIYENGQLTNGLLFVNPFYATGYPITEAYWANVKVGGVYQDVLMQCFERRCLTYTPGNDEGWKVEAGNVGQHYYTWRHGSSQGTPTATATATATTTATTTATSTATSTSTQPTATTFSDGTHLVGSDIQAGTYRNSNSSQGCYWERRSGLGDEIDDILAIEFTLARSIVTIKPSDVAFMSDHCGTWSSDLSAITSSPTASFGDGVYIVGTDIAAGTWSSSSSTGSCYWARLSGFSGDFDEIIDNDFVEDAIQTVTVQPSDAGFYAVGCGTWTKTG